MHRCDDGCLGKTIFLLYSLCLTIAIEHITLKFPLQKRMLNVMVRYTKMIRSTPGHVSRLQQKFVSEIDNEIRFLFLQIFVLGLGCTCFAYLSKFGQQIEILGLSIECGIVSFKISVDFKKYLH